MENIVVISNFKVHKENNVVENKLFQNLYFHITLCIFCIKEHYPV